MKFNLEMEKAVLNGTKTQTRRLMKPQPVLVDGGYFWPERKPFKFAWSEDSAGASFDEEGEAEFCPYGAVGHQFTVGGQSFQITNLRTERIQDISEEAALAEGVDLLLCPQCGCSGNLGDTINTRCHSSGCGLDNLSAIERFKEIWEEIYPGSWERNDWVWVIEFKKVGPQ